jgi:hypothetical protein
MASTTRRSLKARKDSAAYVSLSSDALVKEPDGQAVVPPLNPKPRGADRRPSRGCDMIFDLKIDARAKVAVASDCRRPRCRYIGSAPSPCQPLCRINPAGRKGLWGEPRAEAVDGSPRLRFKPLTRNEKDAAPHRRHPRRGGRPGGTRSGRRRARASIAGESPFPPGCDFPPGADRPIRPMAFPIPTGLLVSRTAPRPHARAHLA